MVLDLTTAALIQLGRMLIVLALLVSGLADELLRLSSGIERAVDVLVATHERRARAAIDQELTDFF